MNKIAKILSNFFYKTPKNRQVFKFDDFNSCLIVTNQDVPKEFLDKVKNPTLIFYSENNSIPKGRFFHLDKNDMNWMGKIKDEELKEILAKNYDLFINYNTEKDDFLDFLYKKNNSKLKVNYQPASWSDIEINVDKNNKEEYFGQLYTILEKIN